MSDGTLALAVPDAARRRPARWRTVLRRRPASVVALAVLAVLVLAALLAPLIDPWSPLQTAINSQLEPPSAAHWFGTDELGRDLLTRVIYGTRVSLLTALLAMAGASVIGVPIGLAAGYFGGWLEAILMRLVDVLLAVPAVLVAMALIAILGRGTLNAALAVAVVNIPAFARLTRASTLSVKEMEYVASTRAAGAGSFYILTRTILPNCLGPVVVQLSVTAATAILLESGLSFLGLGTQPPTPSWGAMLSSGQSYLYQAPWYGVAPGILLMATVLSLDELSRLAQVVFGTERQGALSL